MVSEVRALEEARDQPAVRRARNARRAGLTALLVLVLGGLVGVFGIRTATATSTAQGYTLAVTHAQVTRAGIAVPFHVEVRHEGGFSAPVELDIEASLMERFDFQNFYPNPSKETADNRFLVYQFDPPPSDVFRLSLDARTAPDQNGSIATYTVRLVEGGSVVTHVSFRMAVAP